MPRIDHILNAWDGQRRAVLGTVVDLRGSGYRRPGARILIEEGGEYIGAISGGCLEKDVVRSAWNGLDDGPKTVLFDTRASEFHPLGKYGTGCEGIVEVLLRPLPFEAGAIDLFAAIRAAQDESRAVVVCHVYGDETAAVGAAAVWSANGEFRKDAQFDERLVEVVAPFAAEAFESERSIGLEVAAAGRQVRLFVEYIAPPVDLLIIGAGADAVALTEVASPLGWRLRVASTDPVKLRRFSGVETHLLQRPDELDRLGLEAHTQVVVMTHSLVHDAAALPGLLASPARWVGLLGPKRRTAKLLGELHDAGRLPSRELLDKLRTPVGLDLGGEDPWEVAVSIVAQIVADGQSREGGALADRKAPIHPPHELRTIEVEW